jgi:magnesium-dependent phosphatase 1
MNEQCTVFFIPSNMSSYHSQILCESKPKLIVFDCDWTLYPFDCDKELIAPFQKLSSCILDGHGRCVVTYPAVPDILGAIVDAGIPVAFLSRNPSAGPLEQLLRTLPLVSARLPEGSLWDAMPSRGYFHAYGSQGIGKGKDRHFAALYEVAGIEPSEILFFDDLPENIAAAEAKGIASILIQSAGLTWAAFTTGIQRWREKKIEALNASAESYPAENGQPHRAQEEER